MPEGATIEALLAEGRTFPPPPEFKKNARVVSTDVYDEAERDYEGFWARQAADLVDWIDEWHTILEWEMPFAKWFVGGTLNGSANCLDRHVDAGHGDQVAYHWEGEPGDTRTITYAQLLEEVQRAANALKSLGIRKGDRVNIYLGMVPELPIAMLACARIGAPHSVVRRTGQDVAMQDGRDVWWDDLVPGQAAECPAEPMDSEDLLYLLYTSGTTAKPKGIMHTTGGYLTQVAWTHQNVFDIKPDTDVYWCAADVGWVTGHSYIVYGPLANRTTSVMYEGTPDFP